LPIVFLRIRQCKLDHLLTLLSGVMLEELRVLV
jgi:hypothetical protein